MSVFHSLFNYSRWYNPGFFLLVTMPPTVPIMCTPPLAPHTTFHNSFALIIFHIFDHSSILQQKFQRNSMSLGNMFYVL